MSMGLLSSIDVDFWRSLFDSPLRVLVNSLDILIAVSYTHLFVQGLIDDAVEQGATAKTELKREGNLIYPAVFDHVTTDMRLAWEEPFGPVLPFIRVSSVEEAIKISNCLLYTSAKKLTEGTENEEFFNKSQEIEEFMRDKKGLIPNVDFYSATVYHTLGIDSDIFTLIFAMSRVAGWIAHIHEQQKNNKLIRPRSQYIGQENMTYIALEKR